MTLRFYPDLIDGITEYEIISSNPPFHCTFSDYLIVANDNERRAYKIIYDYALGPFQQAAIDGSLLLVGHGDHFYLYDIHKKQNLLILKLDMYFSHFYIADDRFYIADASGLFCIDKAGNTVWHNNNLGIDGVKIKTITENQIDGTGEWNPPGGWKDFMLDKKTGLPIL